MSDYTNEHNANIFRVNKKDIYGHANKADLQKQIDGLQKYIDKTDVDDPKYEELIGKQNILTEELIALENKSVSEGGKRRRRKGTKKRKGSTKKRKGTKRRSTKKRKGSKKH